MNNTSFQKTMPILTSRIIVVSALVSFSTVIGAFLFSGFLRQLLLSIFFVAFSIGSVLFFVHGIRVGYLSGRFRVSIAETPIRFWLTIAVGMPILIFAFFFGAIGIELAVSGLIKN